MSDYNERACTKCGSLLHHEDDCHPPVSDEAPDAHKAEVAPRQMIKPLSYTLFAGECSEEYNALRSALRTAAEDFGHIGEYAEYEWLDVVPRTSMVVELVNALHRHGFKITSVSDGDGEHASAKDL